MSTCKKYGLRGYSGNPVSKNQFFLYIFRKYVSLKMLSENLIAKFKIILTNIIFCNERAEARRMNTSGRAARFGLFNNT